MIKLLQIEYMKVKNYGTFWAILGIYAALVPLTYIGVAQFSGGGGLIPSESRLFSFPSIWHYYTWIASCWNMLLGVLVVILVCNEYSFKTERQSVINGLSRRDVIFSKFIFIVVLAAAIAVYTFIIASIIGLIYSGPYNFGPKLYFVVIYFVQTIGYFAFAFLLAVLMKRPALCIIIYVIVLTIDIFLYDDNLLSHHAQYVPTITVAELTPSPFYSTQMAMMKADAMQRGIKFEEPPNMNQLTRSILAFIYIAIMIFVGYFVVKRRDL